MVAQAPDVQFSMKLIKPPDGSCSSSAASFVGVGEALDSRETCTFRRSSHSKGRTSAAHPGTVSSCSVSPPVTLRWPSWLFYIFINNQLSFFPLHFSTKSYFYPSQTWYTSCRKISEGARRFWPFSSGGVKSSITWKGDSSSWFLKLKTCGWLMFFADLCSISSQHHLVRVARTWVALQESASRGDHMADWQRDETKPHPNRHGEGDIGEYPSTAGRCGSVENKVRA